MQALQIIAVYEAAILEANNLRQVTTFVNLLCKGNAPPSAAPTLGTRSQNQQLEHTRLIWRQADGRRQLSEPEGTYWLECLHYGHRR